MSEDTNNAVKLEGGTYEILRNRMDGHGKVLRERLAQLNDRRKEIFGSIDTALIGNERVTTENNCLAQDFVAFGSRFLFAYNVTIGLKSELSLDDVFSVYEFSDGTFHPQDLSFIQDEKFLSNFRDLYKYYKKARFVKFSEKNHHLYMVFRIGDAMNDLKVFKWQITEDGLTYLDDRSVHEYSFPNQHEFEWNRTNRDMHVDGEHPHISIEDRVFVETVGGDLTIKIEDNTEDGEGIYAEEVENKDQTLDDGEIYYATVGSLILFKIRPYQEKIYRYIVFNEKTQTAVRIDEIEDSCILLPDDHGVIFSNGYYLQNGDYKVFENDLDNMLFERRIVSPNGEDFLYSFYNRMEGVYILLSYNLISQTVSTPTICHGFTIFPDGKMIYFKGDEEPKKHHAIQIWQTPFVSSNFEPDASEFAEDFLFKLGNKDIVRCMAECSEALVLLNKDDSYSGLYVDIVKKSTDILDAYFWIDKAEAFLLNEPLKELKSSATAAIDEFDKVVRVKRNTADETKKTTQEAEEILKDITYGKFAQINDFVQSLAKLRGVRGAIITLKDLRYVELDTVESLEERVKEQTERLSNKCVEFLLKEESLDPYREQVAEQEATIDSLVKVTEAKAIDESLSDSSNQLEMLIEIVTNLKIEDATQTTRIIDGISAIFSKLNQVKASLKNKIKDLMSSEGIAEFNAQMKLLNQSVINYLDVTETPEACEEYMTKVMVQLEELESKFSEFDDFIMQIVEKRDEIYSAFEQKKVGLVEARNRRASSLTNAAERILNGVKNRIANYKTLNEINSYFAADMMIEKIRDLIQQLVDIGDSVKSDGIQSQLKTIKEDAIRQLKDKQELFVGGENVIKFGEHKFSVNTQKLDLTIIRRDDDQYFHLTGTKFFEKIEDKAFLATRPVWEMTVVSEDKSVYRAEYLAFKMLEAFDKNEIEETAEELSALEEEAFLQFVQKFMGPRYAEGYVKGIHDADAAKIFRELIRLHSSIGLLRYAAPTRALARAFWYQFDDQERKTLISTKLKSFGVMKGLFQGQKTQEKFITELHEFIQAYVAETNLFDEKYVQNAAEYLFHELCEGGKMVISFEASELFKSFQKHLKAKRFYVKLEEAIKALDNDTVGCFELIRNWVEAYIDECCPEEAAVYADEVAALIFTKSLELTAVTEVSVSCDLEKMLGDHTILVKGQYRLNFNDFMLKLQNFERQVVPKFNAYVQLKKDLSERTKKEMRLHEFEPRILSSFVRNKLINDVYLPIVGDNLAKQMGVVGENKRTDLMGMLLLISPPGYGKTTLMEYISNRLGLIFMKINAPAIGHHVTSLDPSEAPNASAREELNKLNLALEMGDNVMIYLDDIQHSNPELLQKFISLCDGQRKIEGVYKGEPKTYDLRGRKVCVCMAGNPYTESGDKFQIPDMLANRADTYNLGDIIGDTADTFNMSYIENALTSNPVLNKLNTRSQKDVYALLQIAETDSRDGIEFEASYSAEEVNEIVSVFKKLIVVRDIISKVNQQYIISAAQQDEYRTEPSFKLQGSYRNMSKITEKVLPVMNDDELQTLILSHYENESQTLTTGAEFNVLRFRELFEAPAEGDEQRLVDIRKTFAKNLLFNGADESDPMTQVVVQMGQFSEGLDGIKDALSNRQESVKAEPVQSQLNLSPETIEELKSLFLDRVLKASEQAPEAKEPNELEIIPNKVEIVNTVPDFFAHIVNDQLKLMEAWMQPLLESNLKHGSDLSKLTETLDAMKTDFNHLQKFVGKGEQEVKKTNE